MFSSYLRSKDNSAVNPEHNTVYQVSTCFFIVVSPNLFFASFVFFLKAAIFEK